MCLTQSPDTWLQSSPSLPSRIERLANRGRPYMVELVLPRRAPGRPPGSHHQPAAAAGCGWQGSQPRQPDHAVPDAAARPRRRAQAADCQHRRGLTARQGDCGAVRGPGPLGMPAALHQQPNRTRHRAAEAAASDGRGVTAGFRFSSGGSPKTTKSMSFGSTFSVQNDPSSQISNFTPTRRSAAMNSRRPEISGGRVVELPKACRKWLSRSDSFTGCRPGGNRGGWSMNRANTKRSAAMRRSAPPEFRMCMLGGAGRNRASRPGTGPCGASARRPRGWQGCGVRVAQAGRVSSAGTLRLGNAGSPTATSCRKGKRG
jgi:hypothetical protein